MKRLRGKGSEDCGGRGCKSAVKSGINSDEVLDFAIQKNEAIEGKGENEC